MFCASVLRNFTKFTGKHVRQSLFFNKVANLRPATLLKKRLWHRCFLVNFVNFCKNIFFAEHFWTAASKSALIILDRHLLVSVCRNLYWALSHIVLILSSLKNFLRCTIWRERLSRLALMHIHWEKDIMTKILFFFPFFVFLI